MLKLCNIIKNYPSATTTVHALRGVSLSFREHEFVSILGPSGCGKTTMLNIIGGLDRYTSGDLIIGGVSTASFDDMHWDAYRNATIGFVFQSYNLIPHLTVLENVEIALSLVGEKKKVRRAKAIEALRKVGIEGEINKRPNQLSGGQMQRVAIARAIVNDPKIILADEPTGALDSELSVQVMEILKEISESRLVIMVTHNAELAREYSTRICRFKDGQLIEDTNPYEYDEGGEENQPETDKNLAIEDVGSIQDDGEDDDDIITADAVSLDEDVHVVASATDVDYDSLAIEDDEDKKKRQPSNRKRKKQIKRMGVDSSDTFEKLGLNSLNKKRKKQLKKDKAFKPTAMNAGMAFGLSVRNLVSKLRRTALTAFAGSIGIIGLGLVLSISNGFSLFVEKMQSDMLAGVPVSIYEYNIQTSAFMDLMTSLATPSPKDDAFPDTDKITIKPGAGSGGDSIFNEILSAFFESVSKNDLSDEFATYIENMPDSYYWTKTIFYGTRYNLVAKTADGRYIDASQQPQASNTTTIATSVLGEAGMQPTYWQVMPDNMDAMLGSYDMIGENSRYPQNKNELLLCIGDNNQIDQKLLDTFGISTDGIDAENINADFFIGKSVKLIHNNHYYEQYDDYEFNLPTHADQTELETMYNSSNETLRIVGVIRPKKGAAVSYVSGSICYTAELAKYVVDQAFESDIAKAQRYLAQHPEVSDYNTVLGKYYFEKDVFDSELNSGSSIIAVIGNKLEYTSFMKAIGATKAPTYINLYPMTYDQKESIGNYISDWNSTHEGKVGYLDVSAMLISNLNLIIDLVSIILIAVASISLIVSTVMIGVITSNSVIERIREIGILRAIGARKRDIRHVFIAETSLIGLTSGLMGIIATYILCPIISLVIGAISGVGNLLHFNPLHALLLVVLSLALTVISGVVPAVNASRKNVVDALRVD